MVSSKKDFNHRGKPLYIHRLSASSVFLPSKYLQNNSLFNCKGNGSLFWCNMDNLSKRD